MSYNLLNNVLRMVVWVQADDHVVDWEQYLVASAQHHESM